LLNGRSVVVRINDRGPFVANRLIDLSYTAAAKLDMVRDGTTLVEVRALTPGVPDQFTRSAQAPPPSLYVQAGAFADERNAQRLPHPRRPPRLRRPRSRSQEPRRSMRARTSCSITSAAGCWRTITPTSAPSPRASPSS